MSARRLAVVVAGSLSKGIEARLDGSISIEDMAVGRYVVIDGRERKFFGMVTDVRLDSATPEVTLAPPDPADSLLGEVLAGTSTFGTLEIAPMLTIGKLDAGSLLVGPQPVKTVPSHFAAVSEAEAEDVAEVFGEEDATHFEIGRPLDMDTPVCLDLRRFAQRSSGVFGKSGTGKTFLTRLLLAGIVQKEAAVNLVFDMHSEYGWSARSEGAGREVKGLKQLFGEQVSVFTLDPETSRARGVQADHNVTIGLDQIEMADLDLARSVLGITDPQFESAHRIAGKWGHGWLRQFLATTPDERRDLSIGSGLLEGTVNALHRRLERLARLPFLKADAVDDSVGRILESLLRRRHVVLEFGHHGSLDAYILVANFLTRRIHEAYVDRMDRAHGDAGKEPPPLVITIEEAHKFLAPDVAGLTIFGEIARELRKYNVTLLVVDQRPSGIADEVMSQIGTRVTCLLDDEKDIAAVLSGIPGSGGLRSVLARLDSTQQAILLGHAVPMPVVIRTRDYGPDFYSALARARGSSATTSAERAKEIEELFSR